MHNKCKMTTEHIGNPLKDVTKDCFVSEAISDVGEESDDNDADDDETTTVGLTRELTNVMVVAQALPRVPEVL